MFPKALRPQEWVGVEIASTHYDHIHLSCTSVLQPQKELSTRYTSDPYQRNVCGDLEHGHLAIELLH